jgi:hypothetical protein
MLSIAIPAGVVAMFAAMVAVVRCLGPRPPLLPLVGAGVGVPVVLVFVMGRALVAARGALLGRMGADSPAECWPLDVP